MTVPMIKSIGDVPYPIDTHSDVFSPLLTAGAALGITGEATESAAWLQRTSTSDGPTTVKSIHGRTLRWNQLVSDSDTSVTVPSGHKYVARIDGTTTLATSDGTAITVTGGTDNVFDLTVMFGAGSEPSTIAEFTALYPLPYYPYDAGSLLPVNMTGIESTAADESWTEQRTIPAGTLRSAGSVYDELTSTEVITRVRECVVDGTTVKAIGSTAPTGSATAYRFTVPLPNATFTHAPDFKTSGIFEYSPDAVTSSAWKNGDATFNAWGGTPSLLICIDGPTSTTQANAWLAEHPFTVDYPVTPTVTPIDPPLNLTYRTEQGGTERVMVPTGENSAPPTIVAAQGYTAESLRDAALSCIAPVENGLASTNYGVGSYLVHAGQLCKVTTAIAIGEAISIGTNVVTTTVMAEVLSITQ